ncbi:hypothetical protein TNCV_2290471 [Trichonephila clavipes]|uniref:Uncharacterized protein n=1 Tax=Trichonephila clavipes TaxID=2585209 RepID=A0A8X6RJJ7_TRICX|nr:hypothetical protein TNCV_2290471 [Trichonephila clavipes]
MVDTGSSPVPLKTRCVGQRCTLNLSRAETSSRWCGAMPTPVPWPAALELAGEDPWHGRPDRDGPTDPRLGLSQKSLLARG